MTTVILSCLAVALAGPVPGVLARIPTLRRTPRATTTLWQAVAAAAVLSALGAGLSLVTGSTMRPERTALWYAVAAVALGLTAVVLARLLASGHRVGTRIRALRRRHREVVDLLSRAEAGVWVLAHDAPVAYCLPGLVHARVVVSAGTLARLAADEMAAVLAHERAHLRARHDLVLEAFTVLYEAFPKLVSSGAALREVRLLVEVLADRAALRLSGRLPLARALVALAGSPAPEAALSAGGSGLIERIELLEEDERPLAALAVLAALVYLVAVAIVVLPTAFVAYPWLTSLSP